MENTLTNKFIAWITLLSGLSISAVAVYYSVVGLTAIFAAAVIPIVIMGVTLEISKLVATVWLKQNWKTSPLSLKLYLIPAILVLMFITSMGIFGFLSKAHLEQTTPTSNNIAKIERIDLQINREQRQIKDAEKVIAQLDETVQVLMDNDRIRGPDGAVAVRRSQQEERTVLNQTIDEHQKNIDSLEDQKFELNSAVRDLKLEVGPIRYIAEFFYGTSDEAILEKAVVWVIIVLISVFDPLAVILLLASQHSFQQMKPVVKEVETPLEMPLVSEDVPVATASPNIIDLSTIDPVDFWNKMIKAAEGKVTEHGGIQMPPQPYIWKNTMYPPKPDETETSSQSDPITDLTTSTDYVQNEEQVEGGKWQDLSRLITEKEYTERAELNIQEMILKVRNGEIPFYKVPPEIQQRVKQGLNDGGSDNINNAT